MTSRIFQHEKSTSTSINIKIRKKKNDHLDAEKALDRIQQSFQNKIHLSKSKKGTFPTCLREFMKSTQIKSYLMVKESSH